MGSYSYVAFAVWIAIGIGCAALTLLLGFWTVRQLVRIFVRELSDGKPAADSLAMAAPQDSGPDTSENPPSRREAFIILCAAAAVAFLYALCFSGRDVGPQL
ncbi:MAG: hypothetical protein LBC79_08945 [Deltaproteobacteria bacterium]|jgi:hypothetical protein|nr:hypothetical protein [Deltaproteobacteria bacterium]